MAVDESATRNPVKRPARHGTPPNNSSPIVTMLVSTDLQPPAAEDQRLETARACRG